MMAVLLLRPEGWRGGPPRATGRGSGGRPLGGYKSAHMVRVQHLHEADPDFQTRRALESLTRSLGGGFEATAERSAHPAAEALRRRRLSGAAADVVHAWGGQALAAAVIRGRGRIVFSPTRFPSPRLIRWL